MTEQRNHLDLQINMLAEQENTKMLQLLNAIADKVGVEFRDDQVEALLEPTEPEVLVEEIVRATENDNDDPDDEREGSKIQ